MDLSKLLLKPYLFFTELYSKSSNMKSAFMIVFLTGFLGAGSSLIASRNILPPDIGLAPTLINLLLGGFGIGLLIWILAWMPIRLLSGIEKRHFEIAAWALVPQCLNSLISFVLVIFFPFYVSNPETINRNVKILSKDMQGGLTNPIIHVFGYLAIAWCLFLVYFAVSSIGKDKKKAYLTVGASAFITLGSMFLTSANIK